MNLFYTYADYFVAVVVTVLFIAMCLCFFVLCRSYYIEFKEYLRSRKLIRSFRFCPPPPPSVPKPKRSMSHKERCQSLEALARTMNLIAGASLCHDDRKDIVETIKAEVKLIKSFQEQSDPTS